MFPIDEFLKELNQTPFIVNEFGQTDIRNDWKVKYIGDTNNAYYELAVESSLFRISMDINVERVNSYNVFSGNESIHRHFKATFIKVLENINYDCFLKRKDGKGEILLGVNKKTKEMYSWIENLIPFMKIHMPRNRPHLEIPHLRHELDVKFNYDEKSVGIYYFREKITVIKSKEDAEIFRDLWLSRSKVITDIADDVLELCLKYDKAAFLIKNRTINIIFFSREMHLGFSYYMEDNKLYYFTTLFSNKLGRYEETFTDVKKLKENVMNYMKQLIEKSRLEAAIGNKVNSFFYRLCFDIIGYSDDFEDYIFSNENIDEIKKYVDKNYSFYQLRKLEDMDMEKINEMFVDNDKIVKGKIIFEEEVNRIYEFGDYVFLYGDADEHYPSLLVLRKEEFYQKESTI